MTRKIKRNNLYRDFHGANPKRLRKVRLPVPKKGSRLVKIGRLVELTYLVEKPSRYQGTAFRHKMGDKGRVKLPSNTVLATDSKGKNLYIVPLSKGRPRMTRRGIIG